MMKNSTRILLLIVACVTLIFRVNGQNRRIGSGTDLYFAGTSSNQHIDLDTIANAFNTSDFTIEFWEKLDTSTTYDSDIPFICNKDWASGTNKGFVISKMSTSAPTVPSLWVNFTTSTGSRFDLKDIPCPTLLTAWTHIAVTFNRYGSTPKVIVYVNGVASDSANFVAGNNATATLASTLHTRLAQDGTGNYSWGFKYKGFMDELRIWKSVRTADQIRTYMCRKLTGTEATLIDYYDFNDVPGLTLTNKVAGGENGTLKNMSGTTEWQLSGAAIGDSSSYIYPSSLTGTSLLMNSAAHGNVKVNNITGPVSGIQIYRVDTLPNTNNGIHFAGGNNGYYGVFVAQKPVQSLANNPVTYDVAYDYSNYAYAVTNHNNIKLYNRYRNDYGTWADISATNTTATNTFTDSALLTRREFIIGDFTAVTCNDPVKPYCDSVSGSFARIRWASAGTTWQVQYGLQGFMLGSGTSSMVTTTPVANLTGLSNGVNYDVYVRNVCGAGDTSEWVGPLTFKPGYNCPMISNVTIIQLGADSVKITWTGTGSSVYGLEWGLSGFTLGTGIPVSGITTNYYVLHGLTIGQLIDVYIKDSCVSLGASGWFGPISVVDSGHGVGVVSLEQNTNDAMLFPNPATHTIYLQYSATEEINLTIFNTQGVLVKTAVAKGSPYSIDLNELPAGVYVMQCRSNSISKNIKFIIQR